MHLTHFGARGPIASRMPSNSLDSGLMKIRDDYGSRVHKFHSCVRMTMANDYNGILLHKLHTSVYNNSH